jgi:hypothetical protein
MKLSALEYADRVLHEFRHGKKAASVIKGEPLECIITCTDGSIERVTGYWACEIMKRVEAESHD